ncbi:hypothetical protein GYMLUDRAFT_237414 [Collybiopsis luxurians FD-317 M1]|nr:hypothetical protein GYMLUDRAFT_237414 [Collybiopsis luxurians FD-317 M1]
MATNHHYIPLFLLSIALFCIADLVSSNHNQQNSYELVRHTDFYARRPLASSSQSGSTSTEEDDPLRDSELLDIVLVASVDGKFHALNRTSGHLLWSMPSFAPGQGPGPVLDFDNLTATYPSTLAPLVRTVHNQKSEWTIDGDDAGSVDDELYIIEPQSGAIYILPSNPSSTQTSPLRKFPFTMPELVDISPFSFTDPDGHSRLFVGRKETSMLLVELETGKIKASVGGECRWDPFDDMKDEEAEAEYELDLDELESEEEEKPPKTKVKLTEVFIGRTDYHISIFPRKTGGSRVQSHPIQNLSFSTYGPNNQDTLLQSSYLRTKDDSYVQSLLTGELMAFRAHHALTSSIDHRPMLWYKRFPNPIVATFDVLRRPALVPHPNHDPDFHTFVLLQPQPSLTDFHPSLSHANSPELSASLPNSDSAYVGLVEETGSLFAMSPKRFPFFAFGGSERAGHRTDRSQNTIDDVSEGGIGGADLGSVSVVDADNFGDKMDLPVNLDEVTRQRKLREQKENDLIERSKNQVSDICDSYDVDSSNVFDLRCLVGMRKFEDDVTSLDKYAGPEARRLEVYNPTAELGVPSSSGSGSLDSGLPTHSRPVPSGSGIEDAIQTSKEIDVDSTPAEVHAWKWEIFVALLVGLMGVMGVAARRYMSSSTMQPPRKISTPISKDSIPEVQSSSSVTPLSPLAIDVDDSSVHPGFVADPPGPLAPLSLSDNSPPPSPSTSNTNLLTPPSLLPVVLPGPLNPTEAEESDGEGDEVDGLENDAAEPGIRKRKMRRKRGKKKKGSVPALAQSSSNPANSAVEDALDIVSPMISPLSPPLPTPTVAPMQNALSSWVPAPSLAVVPTTLTQVQEPALPPSTLFVSDTVLGFGSHGTVVFRGSLQGRSVAVKRLLRDFVTLASREVSILQESDDHPNVIRYYYQETHANFLYIALELCPGSLADVFESSGDLNMAFTGLEPDEETRSKKEWREIKESIINDPKKAIKQITSGMKHLHALKLVHRDIKPQNILVAAGPGRGFASSSSTSLSRSQNKNIRGPSYRMLISDFGLCKKLDLDQTSFLPTAQGVMGAGTFGWRAPEILKGEVKLDNAEDTSSSKGSAGTVHGNPSSISSSSSTTSSGKDSPTRLTKSVDIFALGCLFYYMLTAGGHPFGERFEREVNIIKNVKDLTALEERYGEEGVDAADLIEAMLNADSSRRPDTSTCLLHPFFWDSGRRLNFLQDASDRFEIMCRDPKDPHLLELEKDAIQILGHDWHSRVDKVFIDNLGKFRKYDGKSVQDLLRALRNKKHHYQDLPDNVKRHLGAMPEGYLSYFTRRYPQLFLHVHKVINDSELRSEPMFRTYFELAE